MKATILLLAFSLFITAPLIAQDQHRRPADIKQYLEQLDSRERDRY